MEARPSLAWPVSSPGSVARFWAHSQPHRGFWIELWHGGDSPSSPLRSVTRARDLPGRGAEVRHGTGHSSRDSWSPCGAGLQPSSRGGVCGCVAEATQGSGTALLPLHPHTRAQKSGGWGWGRGNVGETAAKRLLLRKAEGSEPAINCRPSVSQATHCSWLRSPPLPWRTVAAVLPTPHGRARGRPGRGRAGWWRGWACAAPLARRWDREGVDTEIVICGHSAHRSGCLRRC